MKKRGKTDELQIGPDFSSSSSFFSFPSDGEKVTRGKVESLERGRRVDKTKKGREEKKRDKDMSKRRRKVEVIAPVTLPASCFVFCKIDVL